MPDVHIDEILREVDAQSQGSLGSEHSGSNFYRMIQGLSAGGRTERDVISSGRIFQPQGINADVDAVQEAVFGASRDSHRTPSTPVKTAKISNSVGIAGDVSHSVIAHQMNINGNIVIQSNYNNMGLDLPEFSRQTRQGEEILKYLSRSNDLLYWAAIFKIIGEQRNRLPGRYQVVVSLATLGIEAVVKNLDTEVKELKECQGKSVSKAVISGVEERIRVVSNFLDAVVPEHMERVDRRHSLLDNPATQPCKKDSAVTFPEGNLSRARIFEAYPRTPEHYTISIIGLVSILTTIAAAIFLSLGFASSDHTPGTVMDADFWFQVEASTMTILGILVSILPVIHNDWLTEVRIWMWIFTVAGVLCANAAIPMYLFLPKEWSSVVAFLGSAMACYTALVLTQAVDKAKKAEENSKKIE